MDMNYWTLRNESDAIVHAPYSLIQSDSDGVNRVAMGCDRGSRISKDDDPLSSLA